ncbi:MAG: DMT family transporter [Desulfobulbaceae bacterium]
MSKFGLLLVITCSLCAAVSSFLFRISIARAGGFSLNISSLVHLALQPLFIIGLFLYAAMSIIWLRVLATEPLTIVYPLLISLTFLLVTCGGMYFFKELITLTKITGLVFIISGIILVGRG